MVACRKGERKVFQRIAFIVVLHSITKVDGIGRIGLQRVSQFDGQRLCIARDGWRLDLWWRDGHFLVGIVELDVLVEAHCDLLPIDARRCFGGLAAHKHGRCLVVESSTWRTDTGTPQKSCKR